MATIVYVKKLIGEDESFLFAGGVLFLGVVRIHHEDLVLILLAPGGELGREVRKELCAWVGVGIVLC